MYQNIFVSSRTEDQASQVYIWDDIEGLVIHPYKEFHYAYRPDPRGKFTSIYGDKLMKCRPAFGETGLFESDLSRETRVLTDVYLSSDDSSINHRTLIIDIETSSEGGFATPSTAEKKITAFANYFKEKDEYTVFLLDETGTMQNRQYDNKTIRFFTTEIEMLDAWMQYYLESKFTIITGWNVDQYDIPYIYNRLWLVMGRDFALLLSPIMIVEYNEHREKWRIAGVSVLDYMALYKKYNPQQKPSYRLDAIAKSEIGKGKVEYEGTLDMLYQNDIETFLRYALNDVELLVGMDNKLQYIDLARAICHLGHVPYEDFGYSSKWIEGAILTYLHRKNIIAPNKPEGGREAFNLKLANDDEGFVGAYVKAPTPGLYDWVYSLDLTSLYPSILMSLNISPETKAGRVVGWDVEQHITGVMTEYKVVLKDQPMQNMTRQQFVEFMNSGYNISSNGILYSTKKLGIIPEILDKWFAERKEFKNLSFKHDKEGNAELAAFYDRRQAVQKVLLNSIYGVLGLSIFRFYDLDNAAAVTLSGQDVIKTTAKFINDQYVRRTKESSDFCVYIDTDSVYFKAPPMFPFYEGSDAKQKTIAIAKDMEAKLNSFYDVMAQALFFCRKHRYSIKGESVIKAGLWVAKKRYAMKKVYDLEKDADMDKLKVTGLDVVRSSFPPAFQKFMSEVLTNILDRRPKEELDAMILAFREELNKMDYLYVAKNTSVKQVSKYDEPFTSITQFPKGTPAHCKAALAYNRMLAHYGIAHLHTPIRDGDKIKWVYLKANPLGISGLAVKTYDDPPQIIDYIREYIDYNSLFEKELANKLADFYSALGWGLLPTAICQSLIGFLVFEEI